MNPSIHNRNTDEKTHPSTAAPAGEGPGVRFLITGAAGFIGSCLVQFLNEKGYHNLLLCDDFGVEKKRRNWEGTEYEHIIERYNLFDWLETHEPQIDFVFHLGARTDTTEFNYAVHQELNVDFSQNIWRYCTEKRVPLVYASSAATYGAGELGYKDDEATIPQLQPLNPYGISKNEIDKWVLQQTQTPPFWAGLKFFNVYGPNEYHKDRMASVIWHAFNQIKKTGQVKLFKSHRPEYKDGWQLRDFIYVKDVVKVMYWMMESSSTLPTGRQVVNRESSMDNENLSSEAVMQNPQIEGDRQQTADDWESPKVWKSERPEEKQQASNWRQMINDEDGWDDDPSPTHSRFTIDDSRMPPSAIYNLGTGTARCFYDLAVATFRGLDKEPNIVFINMPEDIRDKYQYFTEADMQKLRDAGYHEPFYTLEDGVDDYIRNHLRQLAIV